MSEADDPSLGGPEASEPSSIPVFPESLASRFVPLSVLGKGGMGIVWRARDTKLGRDVALKLLHLVRPELRLDQRFAREAGGLVRVRHPHVVAVYDYGECEGGAFLALELVEGSRLDRVTTKVDLVEAMLQVASGLDAVHAAGLLHRDVKPANVIHSPGRGAVLVDFGLVLDPDRTRLTRKEAAVGTIVFLAPEIVLEGHYSAASDYYAWGISLFLLMERKQPYSMNELTDSWKTGTLPPPPFTTIDPGSPPAALIRRCLAWDPADRPRGRPGLEAALRGEAGPASRVKGPFAVPAPPAPRSLPALRAALVGAGITLAMGLLVIHPAPAPEATPAPSLPEAPRYEPDPDALRDQIEAAPPAKVMTRFLATAPAGTFPAPEEGSYPLLYPDPGRFSAQTRALPEVHRFHAFVAAGGRTESLPAPAKVRLREMDTTFSALGLPPPFWPYVYLDPAEGPAPPPPLLATVPDWPTLVGIAPASGWLRTGFEQLARAVGLAADLDRDLLTGFEDETPMKGFPPELWANRRLLPHRSVWELTRSVSARTPDRTALRGLLRPGAAALHAALYALGRAMESEPVRREALALLFLRPNDRLSVFWYDAFATLDPELLLGGPPASPAAAALAAWLARLRRTLATRMELPGGIDRSLEAAYFERGAEEPPGPRDAPGAELAFERADRCFSFAVEYRNLEPGSDPERLVAEISPRLARLDPALGSWVALNLADSIAGRLGKAKVPGALKHRLGELVDSLPEVERPRARALLTP